MRSFIIVVMFLMSFVASAATGDLFIGASPTRSPASSATLQTITTPVYPFVEGTAATVTKVDFWLDGVVVKTEGLAPYDMGGTAANGTALPVTFAIGGHVLRSVTTLTNGTTINKTFLIDSVLATPVPTPTPTPTPSPTPAPVTWTFCANEWQTCSFTGTREVRYGKSPTWIVKTFTSSLNCNNTVFGSDPLPGIAKTCEYSSVSVTPTPTPTPVPTATPSPTPTPTPTPVPVAAKKWYPGHYVNGSYGNDIPLAISRSQQSPNFKGVNFLNKWIDMETSKGVYNFSRVDDQLAAAKAAGKRMMIQIMDQSYSGGNPCVPSYMRTDPLYQGGQSMIGSRCVALRHVAAVQDRMNALYAALAAKYDNDPYFVGVSITEEDSYPTNGTNMGSYSAANLITQEKRGMLAAATYFKKTPCFKWLNWGVGNAELFAYGQTVGVGVGGPDLDPKSPTYSYPGNYQAYFGKIPLMLAVQSPRVDTTVANGSNATAMINYGVSAPPTGLGLNFIVWDQPFSSYIRFDTDIIPAINARPGVQTGCPTSFLGGCSN